MVTRSQLLTPSTALTRVMNAWNSRRERRAIATLMAHDPRSRSAADRKVRRAITFLGQRNPIAVRNWYESGFPFRDGTQSWLPSIIQDARYDQNLVTRREMLRRMRFWSQNSELCKSALDVSRQYTIGTHAPVVTSLASDSQWGQTAETVFGEMIAGAGLDGESLFQMLTVAHDCKKVDGDILFIETARRAPLTIRAGTKYETEIMVSRPCYQMVEGHRIETPPNRWKDEGKTVIDGVQFEVAETKLEDGRTRKVLKRIGYWVKDSLGGVTNEESYSFIPSSGSVFVFSPHRVNQIRGLSDFYAVEPTLALLEDLLKLEMRAQEVQSDLTVFITNGAGQLVDPKMQGTLGALGINVSQGNDGKPIVTTDDIKKAQQIYEQVWGGKKFVGRTNDTLAFLAPNRPAEATLNLWDFLINSFCAGCRQPRTLVFPKSNKGQGTEVRAELDKANAGYIAEFNLNWKPLIARIWEYFIGWAIKNDARLANAPADWKHIEVSPPRSVLVDVGYDSAAQIAELAAGITNLHFIAQRLGTTRQKLIDAAVSDLVLLKKACARVSGEDENAIKITAAEVRQSLSDVVKNLAAMKAAEAQKQTAELAQAA